MRVIERDPPKPRSDLRLLAPFRGTALTPPPIWLMRQAGRYLPEYRSIRARVGSFLDLCYTPPLAAEVTLQPVRRFGFDAAILFSDILVVPDALGQRVEFTDGSGPRLDPLRTGGDVARLEFAGRRSKLERVFETVARVRRDLPDGTALIGFCGAPWTVATYMVGGGGSTDHTEARLWAYRDARGFGALTETLISASIEYLKGQIEAGADALQIFESWGGGLPEDEFDRWVIEPTAAIVRALKAGHPDLPIIGFPRGAGERIRRYAVETGVDGVSCDTAVPLEAMRRLSESGHVVQGNLDPLLLLVGGPAMEGRTKDIVDTLRASRFIFNLGHGIVPDTPPENVARLVELVRTLGA